MKKYGEVSDSSVCVPQVSIPSSTLIVGAGVAEVVVLEQTVLSVGSQRIILQPLYQDSYMYTKLLTYEGLRSSRTGPLCSMLETKEWEGS